MKLRGFRFPLFFFLGLIISLTAFAQNADLSEAKRLYGEVAELYKLGKIAEAVSTCKKALQIFEKFGGPNNPEVAGSLNTLAGLYAFQGNFAEAEPLYQRLLEMCDTYLRPDHPDVAVALSSLASVHYNQGKFAEALPLYQRALKIREKLNPLHPDTATSYLDLAEVFRSLGNYAEAEPLFQKGLRIRRKALGPSHFGVAFALASQAGLYRDQGKTTEAEPLLQQALKLMESSVGPDHAVIPLFLNNLAELYRSQGSNDRAEPLYRRALKIIEKSQGFDHPNLAPSLNNLAEISRGRGNYAEAEPLYLRAWKIMEKTLGPDHPGVAGCLNNLAELYRAQGKFDEAEPLYQRALESTERVQGHDHPAAALYLTNLGVLSGDRGKYAEAVQYLQRGFELLEKGSQKAGDEAFTAQIRKSQQIVCRWFLSFLYQLTKKTPAEAQPFFPFAFQATEQARSREFLDQLLSRTALHFSAMSPEDRKKEAELSGKTRSVEELKNKETVKPMAAWNKTLLASLEQQLGGIRADRKQFEDDLRKKYPKYLELRNPPPVSVEQIQREVLGGKEKLISFWADDERLFAFVIGKKTFHFLSTPVASQALVLAIAQFRDIVSRPGEVALFKRAGHTLYKQIFSFLSPHLNASETETLFIVPYGLCQSVPFELLLETPNGGSFETLDYLYRKFHFAYVPSAMVLRAIRGAENAAVTRIPRDERHPVILFGDPVYSPDQMLSSGTSAPEKARGESLNASFSLAFPNPGASETLKALAPSAASGRKTEAVSVFRNPAAGLILSPLPGTRIENEEIANLYYSPEKVQTHAYFGIQAQETKVKSLSRLGILSHYRILHFATHGLLPREVQGLSEPCIALSLYGDRENDGFLKMGEIFSLQLNADLVTLSACQTGIEDDPVKSQGLSGLARAFFYAGTSRLLVSLWSVSDQGTSVFMKTLYSILKGGRTSYAEALKQTRDALLSSREFSHPRFWAPFILLGEWRQDHESTSFERGTLEDESHH